MDSAMQHSSKELLNRLGDGESIEHICETSGITRGAFDAWWQAASRARVPVMDGVRRAGVERPVRIERDSFGINKVIEDSHVNLPIEFDLLDYQPEPWSPVDCLTIEGEFRWYLTGRFPVIVIPELARRALGDGPLFRAFLQAEADSESILPEGSYPRNPRGRQPVGTAVAEPDSAQGSNNWVLAGKRTGTGRPLLASDPHIAFDAVSCWYEVHLCRGSFNTAGVTYVGMPAVM